MTTMWWMMMKWMEQHSASSAVLTWLLIANTCGFGKQLIIVPLFPFKGANWLIIKRNRPHHSEALFVLLLRLLQLCLLIQKWRIIKFTTPPPIAKRDCKYIPPIRPEWFLHYYGIITRNRQVKSIPFKVYLLNSSPCCLFSNTPYYQSPFQGTDNRITRRIHYSSYCCSYYYGRGSAATIHQ